MVQAPSPRAAPAPATSEFIRLVRMIMRSPLTLAGVFIVAGVLMVALLAPWLAPYPEDAGPSERVAMRLKPPSRDHLLGTDWVGRDMLSRILIGTRISLGVGVSVTLTAMAIGIPIGMIAGYAGGLVDELLMRVVDVVLAFPTLVLAVLVASSWGPGITNAMIAIAITWWPKYARLVRGQTLMIKELQYIEAARAAAATPWRVLFRHVLPNCLSPLTVQASLDIGYMILIAASLSFVGLGAQPPVPEWGLMISTGRKYMPQFWWISVFPGLAILTTVMGFNLMGDGLRDALDPRTRRLQG